MNGAVGEATLSREGAIFPSAWERLAPYFSEFLGTYLLTLTFLYNYGYNKDPVWAATSNGLMVTALVYAFMHISGANLNPSVSIAMLLAGRHSPGAALRLCATQVLGATAAAVTRYQFSNAWVNIGPVGEHTWRAVITVEILYSAMLCFVYLNCAASTKNNPLGAQNGFVGLAVGFCFIAGGYAAREISHTVMNSAIAVGLGLVDSKDGISLNGLIYIMADTAGAFIGTGAYRIVRPSEAGLRTDTANPAAQAALALRRRNEDSAKVAAEFVGTFAVVFTKALNRLGQTPEIGPEAWSVAAALTSMVCALRSVSGGYFNPAVTLGAVLSGQASCSRHVAVFYILVQVLAAVAASSLFAAMNRGRPIPLTFGSRARREEEIFAECGFTFLITYTVLAMSAPTRLRGTAKGASAVQRETMEDNDIAGFAYGACHIAGGFAVGNISGGMLNPAVVLSFSGLDLLKGHVRTDVIMYLFYQVAGALLATGAFLVTHVRLCRDGLEDAENQLAKDAA